MVWLKAGKMQIRKVAVEILQTFMIVAKYYWYCKILQMCRWVKYCARFEPRLAASMKWSTGSSFLPCFKYKCVQVLSPWVRPSVPRLMGNTTNCGLPMPVKKKWGRSYIPIPKRNWWWGVCLVFGFNLVWKTVCLFVCFWENKQNSDGKKMDLGRIH